VRTFSGHLSEWQWHQLGHMQVCTSLQTDNHASTPPLSFLQAGCQSTVTAENKKQIMFEKVISQQSAKITTHALNISVKFAQIFLLKSGNQQAASEDCVLVVVDSRRCPNAAPW